MCDFLKMEKLYPTFVEAIADFIANFRKWRQHFFRHRLTHRRLVIYGVAHLYIDKILFGEISNLTYNVCYQLISVGTRKLKNSHTLVFHLSAIQQNSLSPKKKEAYFIFLCELLEVRFRKLLFTKHVSSEESNYITSKAQVKSSRVEQRFA